MRPQGKSYADRRKFYMNNNQVLGCLKVSGEPIASAVQVLKVPQKSITATTRRFASDKRESPDARSLPSPKNPTVPKYISYRDIRTQITTRADAECPKPPPNTPPRLNKYTYQCGDFIYEIPSDDHYTQMLFEQDRNHVDEEEGLESGPEPVDLETPQSHLHSKSSVSLPPPNKNKFEPFRVNERSVLQSPRGSQTPSSIDSFSKLKINGTLLKGSVSAYKFDTEKFESKTKGAFQRKFPISVKSSRSVLRKGIQES